MKYQLQARRQATARARRYFRDYELNLKSKLQKKRTNEEQVCLEGSVSNTQALMKCRGTSVAVNEVSRDKCIYYN